MIKLVKIKAHSNTAIKCLQFKQWDTVTKQNRIIQLPLAQGLKRIANGDIFKLNKVIWADTKRLDGSPSWTWAHCCIKRYSQHLKNINDQVVVKDAGGNYIATADIIQV